MQFRLYQWLTHLAGPFIDLYLMKRKAIGKEDPERFSERLGHASFPRPSGTLVWVHAASVGEAMSVLPLIKALIERYKTVNILFTTGTVASARMLEKRLPKRAFHQYVPVDRVVTVRRFLKHWKPDLALWVESELWPNLIIEAHKAGCPMVQVNATISPESFERWKRAKSLARRMLGCFSLTLAQDPEDRERLEALGALHTKYIGNLKFDAPALPADPKETGTLVAAIGERPVWVAVSTHPGEETLMAEAHQHIMEKHPELLTIIVPRHPERGAEIAADMAKQHGLKAARRAAESAITEETQVYIADTIGELGIFFRLTGIVFMGGSLVSQGGHNPLEAARLECAILAGPHTEHFSRIYDELKEYKAYQLVDSARHLANTVDALLTDHEAQEALATAAQDLVEKKGGVLDGYLEAITPYLSSLVSEDAVSHA